MSNPTTKYGLRWPGHLDTRLIDLAMYSSDKLRQRGKPLSRWEHLRLCIKGFLPDSVFRWHRWVDEFGEAWCEHSGIAVWGAGGTTKSGILGCLAYFDLLAEPRDTLHVMITNPLEKHWDRGFSKLLMWRNAMPDHLKIGRLIKSPKPQLATVEAEDGSRRGVICVSIEPGETADQVAKKVGAHAPRTRLSLDEGQGLPESAIDIGVNLFIGSTDKKGIVIGNPTTWQGNSLGAASFPIDNDTARIDRDMPDTWFTRWSWDDRPGKALVFDGTKCPTFDSPDEAKRLFMMIQPSDVEARRKLPGGEKTLMFWQQVKGRIAPQGECATLFNGLDWDDLNINAPRPLAGIITSYVGCDLSLGGDNIPVYIFDVGMHNGRSFANKKERIYITVDATKPDRSGQVARKFVQIIREKSIPLYRCSFDASGQQGAIVDTVERLYNTNRVDKEYAYRVRTEEAVTDRPLSNGRVKRNNNNHGTTRETAKDRYKDRATEVLMNVVELISAGNIAGLDNEVKQQLCTRGYDEDSLDGGKCKAQKKKPWRDANGGRSPDELDSVAVFCTHMLEKKIIVPTADAVKETPKSDLPKWMTAQRGPKEYRPPAARVSVAMRKRY